MTGYIEAHKDRFGVEPICTTLQFAWSASQRALRVMLSPE